MPRLVQLSSLAGLVWFALAPPLPITTRRMPVGQPRLPLCSCICACWCIHAALVQIPYFNAPIFLENKTQIGKVDC